jgi:hypothetical protein
MDLLHLEHFLAVAEEGTFTRAADRVYRTQPAVSQSVTCRNPVFRAIPHRRIKSVS